ncbi:MAG TPA: hydrogenase maturation protease [Candidatus Limnocylindrales bacterium]|nr:hydrogenase maturation protease [Candidatus Limnocylindrales bacterium]
MTQGATLVAGIGNIFLGDDGFGVEVVRRLAERPARQDVRVVDFGIRGLDLAYALLDYPRVILVDATMRGGAPGTLYVLEPDAACSDAGAGAGLTAHGIVPEQALALARSIGAQPGYVRVVGCEPAQIPDADDIAVGLSAPVAAAVDEAVRLIETMLQAGDA